MPKASLRLNDSQTLSVTMAQPEMLFCAGLAIQALLTQRSLKGKGPGQQLVAELASPSQRQHGFLNSAFGWLCF